MLTRDVEKRANCFQGDVENPHKTEGIGQCPIGARATFLKKPGIPLDWLIVYVVRGFEYRARNLQGDIMVNEAGWDRLFRVGLGVALLVIGFAVMDGTAGLVVGIVALVPLLTGIVGWCPLYSLFGFRTNKSQAEAPAH